MEICRHEITVKGIKTYIEEANPKAEPSFLFLHSILTYGIQYKSFEEQLGDRYRIIIPDFPGCGRSGEPVDFSFAFYHSWLDELLEKLQIDPKNTVLYGASLGGVIAASWNQCRNFKYVIFESVPFSSRQITTHEFLYLRILTKIFPSSYFERELKSNLSFRTAAVKIYNRLKPKSSSNPPMSMVNKSIRYFDLKTLTSMADQLEHYSAHFDRKHLRDSALFIYYRRDPTINYKRVRESGIVNPEKLITTDHNEHVPSVLHIDEVLPQILRMMPDLTSY